MDIEKFSVRDVLLGAEQTIKMLCAPGVEFTNKEHAISYLRAMPTAYVEHGIEGLRTQAAYVLCNLSHWRSSKSLGYNQAQMTRDWLRKLTKPGTIIP